jgi:antitoxin ParD1/3/4
VILYERRDLMIRHTISLPEPMSSYIEGRIAEGQYGNVSEYFRDLVRKDQERRQNAIEELRALLEKAEASGISDLTMDQIRQKVRKDKGYEFSPDS